MHVCKVSRSLPVTHLSLRQVAKLPGTVVYPGERPVGQHLSQSPTTGSPQRMFPDVSLAASGLCCAGKESPVGQDETSRAEHGEHQVGEVGQADELQQPLGSNIPSVYQAHRSYLRYGIRTMMSARVLKPTSVVPRALRIGYVLWKWRLGNMESKDAVVSTAAEMPSIALTERIIQPYLS